MDKKLKLAYSTCPNDTFIFYALAHNIIDSGGLKFEIELADVETLNQKAKSGVYDISKLSFAAIGHLIEKYALLRSGAALGRGCGPLLVAKPGFDIKQLSSTMIAVPGMWTTACMLLGLYLSEKPRAVPMPFEKIMPAIQNDEYDCGVIIHEGRFTYEEYGLVKVIDLGEWWEEKTSHREKADNYIKKYAQEMSSDVIHRHINLYVNDFTFDIGEEGEEAIKTLFALARKSGILPISSVPLFINPTI